MHFLLFIPYYVRWHYTRGVADIISNLKNILYFIFHFFSIPVLVKTLLKPWERMGESYKKGFDLESWMETFVLNSLMRIVGFVIRIITIILGIIVTIISFLFSIFIFMLWILMPIFLLFILGIGIAKLI